MKKIIPHQILTLILAAWLSCYQTSSFANQNESIVVTEGDTEIEIGVPVSDIKLFLPKANFNRNTPVNKGATASPRYFSFSDNVTGTSLSGWFEHSNKFKGVQEPHPASHQGVPLIYEDIKFIKVCDWDSVSYNVIFQKNKIASLKANLVRGNTWVELHISGKANEPLKEQHALLQSIINSIKVKVKP